MNAPKKQRNGERSRAYAFDPLDCCGVFLCCECPACPSWMVYLLSPAFSTSFAPKHKARPSIPLNSLRGSGLRRMPRLATASVAFVLTGRVLLSLLFSRRDPPCRRERHATPGVPGM